MRRQNLAYVKAENNVSYLKFYLWNSLRQKTSKKTSEPQKSSSILQTATVPPAYVTGHLAF